MTRPQVASRSEVARGLRASVCAATSRRGSLLYKKLILAALAATTLAAAPALAESANTIKATKFRQSHPYSGKTTVGGGAQVRTNASVTVTGAKKELGGVQLWENGPYWAECNVGATRPEEYGYYFWWGDTVGYTRSGGTWATNRFYGSYRDVTWVSSKGKKMGKSPFDSSKCPVFGKKKAQLKSAGYIDSTYNLVAAHDAATAHLGSPWRMPTDAECSNLLNQCTTTWITTNGVSGRLVTGKSAYADKSIFLPAAGDGWVSSRGFSFLDGPGSYGFYWSSTTWSGEWSSAWCLQVYSGGVVHDIRDYFRGQSVRPVRGNEGSELIDTVKLIQ